MAAGDPRGTQAWRRLSARVAAEEPICWLRLPGCTTRSTTGDHVKPVSTHPHLALDRTNVRGACAHCNKKRRNQAPPTSSRPKALDIFD
jgi:5-methylcytosine-specific restriction endonuclease McrA